MRRPLRVASALLTLLPLLHCSAEDESIADDDANIEQASANPTVADARAWGAQCGDKLLAIGDRDVGAVLGNAQLDGQKRLAEERIQAAYEVSLRRYIQLPTINVAHKEGSKGEEVLGAEFLKAAFDRVAPY